MLSRSSPAALSDSAEAFQVLRRVLSISPRSVPSSRSASSSIRPPRRPDSSALASSRPSDKEASSSSSAPPRLRRSETLARSSSSSSATCVSRTPVSILPSYCARISRIVFRCRTHLPFWLIGLMSSAVSLYSGSAASIRRRFSAVVSSAAPPGTCSPFISSCHVIVFGFCSPRSGSTPEMYC